MNSIWEINVLRKFNTSIRPCEICDENQRTQLVVVVDPFGTEHDQYGICDEADCLKELEKLTVGDGND